MDELQSFIKCSEKYRLLEATSNTAEIEFNVIKTYLVITRNIKSYDEHIGPYDALKIIVEESGKYKMIAYYKVLQEDIVELPITSNKITAALDILVTQNMGICPGISGYSVFKNSIGYDLKQVVACHFPPDSARNCNCTIIFDRNSMKKSLFCSKCVSLKWQLSRRKKEHDTMTSFERSQRQSESSSVAFDILSPVSKRAKYDNMRKSIHQMKTKLLKLTDEIERLSTIDTQNMEVGELVDSINSTACGQQELDKILSEAEAAHEGHGVIVKKNMGELC